MHKILHFHKACFSCPSVPKKLIRLLILLKNGFIKSIKSFISKKLGFPARLSPKLIRFLILLKMVLLNP